MKKTFKYFAAALAIVAAASCSKENTNEPEINNGEMVNITFEAKFNNHADHTKTTLASDGISVHWTTNDALWVFPYTNSTTHDAYRGYSISIINESISEDYAVFSGTVAQAKNYGAIHPASYVNKSGCESNRWSFANNTLRTQTGVKGNFPTTSNGPAHIAMAIGTPGEFAFEFKNSLSYIKFTVDSDVNSIEISADQVSSASGDGTNRALSSSANLGGTLYYRPATGKFDIASGDYTIT